MSLPVLELTRILNLYMFRRKVTSVDYESIHERYQDTALVIYKKQQRELREKSGRRASRKRSLRLSGTGSRISNHGESSNDSAQRSNNVSTVPTTAKTEHDFEVGIDVVISENKNEKDLVENPLGVQSKVCSVL